MEIQKILFFDLETVGKAPDLKSLTNEDSRLGDLWNQWQEKYKELNNGASNEEVFLNKAGLHAEYGKIICASFGYFDSNMEFKINSYYGDDEVGILKSCLGVINNADKKGFYLGGHSIERFDVPFLWKRMLINEITPPNLINVWNSKPWEMKFFDVAKMWGGGSWKEGFTSLDTMSAVLGIKSPKTDLKGSMVHNSYWNCGGIESIKTYCEGDVRATMEIAKKLTQILKPHESLVH